MNRSFIFRILLIVISAFIVTVGSSLTLALLLPSHLWFVSVIVGGIFMVCVIILIGLYAYFTHSKVLKKIIASSSNVLKGEYIKLQNASSFDADLRRLLVTLNDIAHEFANLEEVRKSFVSNVSHELRSPLTSMQGFLQAILDKTIDRQDHDKYLKIVFRETQRLTALINSMLDLSKMESGKNPVKKERFELVTILRQVIERFQPYLIKKGSHITSKFVSELSYVYADKEKIIQVLINLIDNAIKYSPQNSQILVATYIVSKKIVLSVQDNGPGIAKKDQPFIWDRFYMADKAHTASDSKGTGLGLSIVKKIVEDHGEDLWLESKKSGSTFFFTVELFDATKHE